MSDNHQEHPSKVTGWRNGELVGLPDSGLPDATVWFAFGDDKDGPQWEGLLATSWDDGTATIRAVPYFVYDLALGDVVQTMTSAEGALVATERVVQSGMATFRVALEDDKRWRDLMSDTEAWGCWFDVRSPRFLAIAVASDHTQELADYLARLERTGVLQYETGQTRA